MQQAQQAQQAQLEEIFNVKQVEYPHYLQGILYTKDYNQFTIYSDTGDILHEFTGAKLANKCLPGDHISWQKNKGEWSCHLELRDEHPLIVGTIELASKSKYGLTSRGHPMYLFTPYNKAYPHFIVGCSEKNTSKNKIALIKLDDWTATFPRGHLDRILGTSGDYNAEKEALIWQACPWKWPVYNYPIKQTRAIRHHLSGYTFNIDPPGCKDIDDVLTFEKIVQGWKVTITISDVSSYVEDGSPVDIMASLIGQTLYDKNGTVLRPMLPPVYSEETCSLLSGKESYGISMQFVWDNNEIKCVSWFQSIFTNQKSYTYDEFQALDNHEDVEYRYILKEIASYLAKEEIADSHKWIEQMMVLYNTEAGKIVKKMGGILRRHSAPNMEKIEKYTVHLPELKHLAFSSAEYCLAEEPLTLHYGLSSDAYAHASSPIRRYADLINQRVLTRHITKNSPYIVPQAMYDMNKREKAIKQFAYNIDFLDAIQTNEGTTGIVMEKIIDNVADSLMKIRLYIPQWKRMVSTMYKYVSENVILSRDEKKEIEVPLYSEVVVQYACNMNARNWKERVIISLSN
jgi:exoribonuclease R